MSRSLRKELLREIKASRNRFLSILIMVALGVLFLVGLRSAAPDMRATADEYFDEAQLFDIQILSTVGVTGEDVSAFASSAGVSCARGGWSLDAVAGHGDTRKVVKAVSLDGEMNRPTVLEGRLPEGPGECAVDSKLLASLDAGVGDRLTIETRGDLAGALTEETFRITGVADSPLYISLDRGTSTLGDGSVAGFVLLPEESFALDYFTVAYVTVASAAAEDAYGSCYDDLVDAAKTVLEPIALERGKARYDTLRSEGTAAIEEGEQALAQAEAEAQAQIADGEAQLAGARAALDEGWAEYADGQRTYETEIAEARDALSAARQTLDEGWDALAAGKAELEAATAQAQETMAATQAEFDARAAALAAEGENLSAREAALSETRRETEAGFSARWQEIAGQQAALNALAETISTEQGEISELQRQASAYAIALALQQAAGVEAGLYTQETLDGMNQQLSALRQQLAEDQGRLTGDRLRLNLAMNGYNRDYEAAQAGLAEQAAALSAAERDLSARQSALQADRTAYTRSLLEGQQQKKEAEQQLSAAEQTLKDGEAEYAQGLEELETRDAEAQAELAAAKERLEDGEAEYAQGLEELEAARTEAAQQLSEAREELDQARLKLRHMSPADVYVLDRSSNYGFVSYDQNAQRMADLAKMFPVIFFVVAALVCLTTMTRMVEEERTQIGAIKALGFGTGPIAGKFLIYGALAAILGAILGAAVGTTAIPWVIFTSYNIMYVLPHLSLKIHWGLCIGAAAAGLGCTLAATLWAVFSTARQTPAALMRPKAPRAGKRILLERITPLWKRLRFSAKVSARNLFRYKKRLWMTVIGVAGCTGLLIAGLGLRSSIFDILDIQFDEIYRYDVQVALDGDSAAEAVRTFLADADNVTAQAEVNTRSVKFYRGGDSADGYLTVTDDPAALYSQISLREMDSKEEIALPEDGVVIDVKLAELLDLQVGDTITVDLGYRIEAPVRAINEHYVYHYAYMTAGLFRELTGEKYTPNEYLLTVADDSDEAVYRLCEGLMELEGVRSANNLVVMARDFRRTLEVVDAAVMIIILSAAALALVVLYNLTNINITERIRELATIKVLGFYDMEVAMYIYRENIVLTLMGIALGQILGKYLCAFLVRTIELDIVMFGREARLGNYLLSVVLSLVFAVIVNVMMYFRMKKIDMVQSLKSVE